jgi:hypothetical protein
VSQNDLPITGEPCDEPVLVADGKAAGREFVNNDRAPGELQSIPGRRQLQNQALECHGVVLLHDSVVVDR